MSRQALYRFYDAEGVLLYVGITMNPAQRWKDHSKEKPWWVDVAHITLEDHSDREAVELAERAAIRRERPRYNVVHNAGRGPSLVEQNAEGASEVVASDMPDDCHHACGKAGINSMYYPYRWRLGTAHYRCEQGHEWTCGWGHDASGDAPENRGSNALARGGRSGSFHPWPENDLSRRFAFPQVTTQKVHPQVRGPRVGGVEVSTFPPLVVEWSQ